VAALLTFVVLVADLAVVVARGGDSSNARSAVDLPVTPPAPGRYQYKLTSRRETAGIPAESRSGKYALTVKDERGGGQEVRQALVFNTGASVHERQVSWRATGMSLLAEIRGGQGQAATCDWKPDPLELRLPLAAGAAWTAESTCRIEALGAPTILKLVTKRRVTGTETAKVGGTDVEVYVVEGTVSLTVQAGASFSRQDATTKDLFAPSHGLMVRSSTTATTIDPTGRGTDQTDELELVSLKPA
jgi:hypothetical protein